jgi:hypothetical protein
MSASPERTVRQPGFFVSPGISTGAGVLSVHTGSMTSRTDQTSGMRPPGGGAGHGAVGGCPRCGRADRTASVPALYAANQQRWSSQQRHHRFGHPIGTTSGSGVASTAMGRQLAPPQRPPAAATPMLGVLATAFVALLLVTGGLVRDDPDPAAKVLLVLAALLGGGLGVLALHRRRSRLRMPRYAFARLAWQRAWCCIRCGVVFLSPQAPGGTGVPSDPMPMATFHSFLLSVARGRAS